MSKNEENNAEFPRKCCLQKLSRIVCYMKFISLPTLDRFCITVFLLFQSGVSAKNFSSRNLYRIKNIASQRGSSIFFSKTLYPESPSDEGFCSTKLVFRKHFGEENFPLRNDILIKLLRTSIHTHYSSK